MNKFTRVIIAPFLFDVCLKGDDKRVDNLNARIMNEAYQFGEHCMVIAVNEFSYFLLPINKFI